MSVSRFADFARLCGAGICEDGVEVAEGAEVSETFTFDFGENVPSQADLANYYVAVYAHRKTSQGSVMDNIVTCGYGKTVDYQLND